MIVLERLGAPPRLPQTKSEGVDSAVDAAKSTVLRTRRQSLSIEFPFLQRSEGYLGREDFAAARPPISVARSPLRIESYRQRFESPSVSLPRALEHVQIVAAPIPVPRIDTGDFAEWQRTNEMTREIGNTLRELKEREKLNRDLTQKMLQEQQRSVTHPVTPSVPRRP